MSKTDSDITELSLNPFPSEEEMKTAQLLCCGRYCNQCETPAAYALRKRDVDMAFLLEKAIENELSETEREVVCDYWYNSLSLSQIAKSKGITPAAVNKTLDRANEKIERVLSYVVMYQQRVEDCSLTPVVVARAKVIAAAKNSPAENFGQRLVQLRKSKGITAKRVCKGTGIHFQRLRSLEQSCIPDCEELIALSEFFSVSVDYILKGVTNE